jgi:hypothetical protein
MMKEGEEIEVWRRQSNELKWIFRLEGVVLRDQLRSIIFKKK